MYSLVTGQLYLAIYTSIMIVVVVVVADGVGVGIEGVNCVVVDIAGVICCCC